MSITEEQIDLIVKLCDKLRQYNYDHFDELVAALQSVNDNNSEFNELLDISLKSAIEQMFDDNNILIINKAKIIVENLNTIDNIMLLGVLLLLPNTDFYLKSFPYSSVENASSSMQPIGNMNASSSNNNPPITPALHNVMATRVDPQQKKTTYQELGLNVNLTAEQIFEQIITLISQRLVNSSSSNVVEALYPGEVLKFLIELKQKDSSKFNKLINLKDNCISRRPGSNLFLEGNTLLLTALSLEHLDLAKYLITEGASIQVSNDFGIDAINMLAMVHIDKNKYYHEGRPIIIDGILQESFDENQIQDRMGNLYAILWTMQEEDPFYFQENINQPRKKYLNDLLAKGTSNPLGKVIAYCDSPKHLAGIVQIWQSLGAQIGEKDHVYRYTVRRELGFMTAVAGLFPDAFKCLQLKQTSKHGTDFFQELFCYSNVDCSFSDDNTKIIRNIAEIMKIGIENNEEQAINNEITKVSRARIISIIKTFFSGYYANSESGIKDFLSNPNKNKEFIEKLDYARDFLRLMYIYAAMGIDVNSTHNTAVLNKEIRDTIALFNEEINRISIEVSSSFPELQKATLDKMQVFCNELTRSPEQNELANLLRKYTNSNRGSTMTFVR